MSKRLRKPLAMLLAVIMALSLLPTAALAAPAPSVNVYTETELREALANNTAVNIYLYGDIILGTTTGTTDCLQIGNDKTVILVLRGHTLTGRIENAGTLTIMESSQTTGKAGRITYGGELKNYGSNAHTPDATGVVTNLTSGTLRITAGSIVRDNADGAALVNYGTITEITGDKTEICRTGNTNGYVAVNAPGGTIKKITGGAFHFDGTIEGNDSMFINAEAGNGLGAGKIEEISGGTFSSTSGITFKNEGEIGKITGGSFSNSNNSERTAATAMQCWGTISEITGGEFVASGRAGEALGVWGYEAGGSYLNGAVTIKSDSASFNGTVAVGVHNYNGFEDPAVKPVVTIEGGLFKGKLLVQDGQGGAGDAKVNPSKTEQIVISGGHFSGCGYWFSLTINGINASASYAPRALVENHLADGYAAVESTVSGYDWTVGTQAGSGDAVIRRYRGEGTICTPYEAEDPNPSDGKWPPLEYVPYAENYRDTRILVPGGSI